jgi:hypothetical protein
MPGKIDLMVTSDGKSVFCLYDDGNMLVHDEPRVLSRVRDLLAGAVLTLDERLNALADRVSLPRDSSRIDVG